MDSLEFRNYCLSLGEVTENMPFGKFAKRYDSILAFYTCGHMFCFIDIDDFNFVNVRLSPEEIDQIRLDHFSVSNPINRSLKYWIQLNFKGDISDKDIYEYVHKAFELVKHKYTKKR